MLAAFHALIRTVADYPVPLAAVVQGQCLGGAVELVLACQFVFATASARFACPEIKLGVLPPVLAAIGPLRLGHAVSERLLLSGDSLDAEAAHQLALGEPEGRVSQQFGGLLIEPHGNAARGEQTHRFPRQAHQDLLA